MTTVAQPSEALRRARNATVRCTGCRDDYPTREITYRAGWPLCGDCSSDHDRAADRDLTRQLAYAH